MSSRDGRRIGIGQDLGPYRIDALLGTGGMGIVYRAHDRDLERTVAIKIVDRRRSNADSARWLLQEARLAAALNHPGICGVHEVG
jgi:eukaryotic-like serine/threonine-protein kinase